VVAHSYHIFSVEYETDLSLMVLVGTYSRGGVGGEGAVVESLTGEYLGAGAGAVFSAQGFDYTLLNDKEFEEQMGKFLGDHIAVCVFFFFSIFEKVRMGTDFSFFSRI